MAVEILTVSLSDESIEAVANAVHRLLRNHPPGDYRAATESNQGSSQNPQGAEAPGSAPQADPWRGSAPPQQFAPPPAPTTSQAVSVTPGPQQNVAAPMCAHGPKNWVPPGFSKNTGRSYAGFWACPAPRGQQCPRTN